MDDLEKYSSVSIRKRVKKHRRTLRITILVGHRTREHANETEVELRLIIRSDLIQILIELNKQSALRTLTLTLLTVMARVPLGNRTGPRLQSVVHALADRYVENAQHYARNVLPVLVVVVVVVALVLGVRDTRLTTRR